jgi:hypothetical protein
MGERARVRGFSNSSTFLTLAPALSRRERENRWFSTNC